MLKDQGYDDKKKTLYTRFDDAAKDHLITEQMKEWAHEVRLEANAERHVDVDEPDPDAQEAEDCYNFAMAFAEYLYVLPSKIKKWRTPVTPTEREKS